MKTLKQFFLVTDTVFVIYWLSSLFSLLPEEYLYQDYNNPILVAWNWSFFPLDMLVSFTGFLSLYFYRQRKQIWKRIALISLLFTFCSGLQAVSFWFLRSDFDPTWWIPNLFLLIYPLFFIPQFIKD